jgi:hypothetical protein
MPRTDLETKKQTELRFVFRSLNNQYRANHLSTPSRQPGKGTAPIRIQHEFNRNSCAVCFVHRIKAVVLKILDAMQMDQQT